ncbi:SRPBCC family protein [Nocardioides sp. YIM 152315]|uniref:SRPBCC family protein n=1 Tax=Nocardioides sp. YIM 152315 TaxID=3031760 RepID=UPI0023DA9FBD|nr:SRPBCC family protein [Nocardioides sp. YIM 152315]MDF1603885.1 SRPBCC family protein [Nocardioides sp. YIM 152315]
MSSTFVFRDSWEVAASPAAVHGVLVDLEHYPAWWPQVVAVASLGPDDARVLCRSVLPYTLDLVLHAVSRSAERLEVGVSGDLAGSVCFALTPVAAGTRLDFTQEVSVQGWLGAAAYVARPLLRWNHRRMMRGCRQGLDRLS